MNYTPTHTWDFTRQHHPAVQLFHHRHPTKDPSQDLPGMILCVQRYNLPHNFAVVYTASKRLGIIEFKVPNKTPTSTALDTN